MKLKFLSILLNFLSLVTFAQSARYVQVVDRSSQKPCDNFDVSFYHIEGGSFDFIGNVLTDSNGMAKVPEAFGREGKINANNVSLTRKCIWPSVEKVQNFDSGIRVIYADKMTDCGHMRRVENGYFAYDKYELIDFYKVKIDSVISVLNQNDIFKIELRSHTDNKGTNEYNIQLSQKRADSVKAYMISRGIKKERIVISALGSSFPIVPNEKDGQDAPEGRARNRCVEFKIIVD